MSFLFTLNFKRNILCIEWRSQTGLDTYNKQQRQLNLRVSSESPTLLKDTMTLGKLMVESENFYYVAWRFLFELKSVFFFQIINYWIFEVFCLWGFELQCSVLKQKTVMKICFFFKGPLKYYVTQKFKYF